MTGTSPVPTYREPDLPQLLTLVAFLYLLQVFRKLADALFSAGLLGEIALGIIFGSPLAGILDLAWEQTWIVMGYLGLVLIVFEGGLEFDAEMFVRALPLATTSALTGVLLPMAFSFAIIYAAFGYSRLDALSAGAALGSTSLGTTYFVLRSQSSDLDLLSTRFATVLTVAALVDDVIALVLLTVITALGEGSSTSLGWTIGHPIVASVAMAVISPVFTYFVARPTYRRYLEHRMTQWGDPAGLLLGVCVLSAYLAIAFYIQSTMLLGAFLAGMLLSALPSSTGSLSVLSTFRKLVGPVQEYILAPLFFASIGYCIPFLSLFTARLFWQGLVYSIFMTLGKLLVGVWIPLCDMEVRRTPRTLASRAVATTDEGGPNVQPRSDRKPISKWVVTLPDRASLAAGVLLGSGLVARGEIGVLILQVAHSFAGSETPVISDDVYLIGIWAVAICTIMGPVAFAFALKRVGRMVVDGKWGHVKAMDKAGDMEDNHGGTAAK